MTNYAVPEQVRSFILAYIPSILQLEIVLQLHAAGARFVSLGELSASLGLEPATLQNQLEELMRRGLVATQNSPGPVYAYASVYPRQDEAVAELTAAYRDYRVSVINLIYSRPTEKIRTFADAFRILPDTQESPE